MERPGRQMDGLSGKSCLRFDGKQEQIDSREDSEARAAAARFERWSARCNALFGLNFGPLGNPQPGKALISVVECHISWTSALPPIVKDIKRDAQEAAHRNPRGSPFARRSLLSLRR
jgi:hypothetical protein